MSAGYRAVGWSPGKKRYDAVLAGAIAIFLGAFAAVSLLLRPEITIETLLIRGFATVAFLLLHVVLAIGPLARLDRRFLPLLWNRRHLGVTMFVCALAHGGLALFQFHALGDRNPFVSLWISNSRFDSIAGFPFQQLGAAALAILFVMAATSHDFWLANLTAPVWKSLHMMVYLAYALLVAHVALGILQDATGAGGAILLGAGVTTLAALHLAAAWKGLALDRELSGAREGGFIEACRASEIRDGRAKIVTLNGERVAIFRHGTKLSAVSNVCQHQNGPLGEGRIVDGCITCPWHGYQYRPADGRSPEPFTERVPTFRLKLVDGDRLFVDPRPLPAGTYIEPVALLEIRSNKGAEEVAEREEFFVGYLPVPKRLARFARGAVAAIVVTFGLLGGLVASAQNPLGRGEYDFGKLSTTRGLLTTEPIPGIWPQAAAAANGTPFTGAFLPLVGEGKRGASPRLLESAGELVELEGRRIERFGQQVIEAVEARSVSDSAPAPGSPLASMAPLPLGRQRLRGEIVDSKCFYGVMKPSTGKAHRDCAVRCISGGAPPAFVVRASESALGQPVERIVVLLLVGADGNSIAKEVLDLVAEPVEIEGEVSRVGDRLVLSADPAAIRRMQE